MCKILKGFIVAGIDTVSGINFGSSSSQRTNNKQNNKMSKTIKGALIGAGISTGATGVFASMAISTAKLLDEYKDKSFSEKKKFLQSLELEIEKEKRLPCFSKNLRKTMEKIKNPLNWLIMAGIGASIGSIIGYLCKSLNDK